MGDAFSVVRNLADLVVAVVATWSSSMPEARLGDLKSVPMLRQEFDLWRDPVCRKSEWLSLKRLKAGSHRFVGETRAKVRGEHEAKVIIEGDEALVEGCVMESVEGDAIADVEALRFMTTPGQDMGGDEKDSDRQAGEGTAVAIIVEDDLAEIILPAALFGGPGDLGLAECWAIDSPDTVAGDDFGGFAFGFSEEGVEALTAKRDKFGGVFVEFFPDGAVEVAGSREADDAAQLENRIEGCEVPQLHRHARWCAAHAAGEVDDHGLARTDLSEWNLMIEIQDDEKFVTGPADSVRLRHPRRLVAKSLRGQ